jgi:hypothetical protein
VCVCVCVLCVYILLYRNLIVIISSDEIIVCITYLLLQTKLLEKYSVFLKSGSLKIKNNASHSLLSISQLAISFAFF